MIFGKFLESGDDWEATDKFGNQSKGDEILRFDFLTVSRRATSVSVRIGALKPMVRLPKRFWMIFETNESAATDEEDFFRVDLDVFLLRVFAPALGWHIADGGLKDFQQGLLNSFAGDVASDAHVVCLAADLIDFVDVNDAHFATLDVVIRVLKKAEDNVLHVFADIARFGNGGGVGNGEGNVQYLRQCTGEQGFPEPVGPRRRMLLFSIWTSASGSRLTVLGAGWAKRL